MRTKSAVFSVKKAVLLFVLSVAAGGSAHARPCLIDVKGLSTVPAEIDAYESIVRANGAEPGDHMAGAVDGIVEKRSEAKRDLSRGKMKRIVYRDELVLKSKTGSVNDSRPYSSCDVEVVGEICGVIATAEERFRKFAHALDLLTKDHHCR